MKCLICLLKFRKKTRPFKCSKCSFRSHHTCLKRWNKSKFHNTRIFLCMICKELQITHIQNPFTGNYINKYSKRCRKFDRSQSRNLIRINSEGDNFDPNL